MQIPVRNINGDIIEHIEISDDVFGVSLNEAVIHQALVRQQANARQGTASTKTRGQVIGSTRKLYSQKHTGRARRGDAHSPILRGGGIAFGPHPRSYRQRMPKKMRRLALRCVLSSKVSDGELVVVDQLQLKKPKTKEMANILEALGIDYSALVVTSNFDANVIRSARNLPGVKTLSAEGLNVVSVLSHKFLVMTAAAVRRAEQLWSPSKHATQVDIAPGKAA